MKSLWAAPMDGATGVVSVVEEQNVSMAVNGMRVRTVEGRAFALMAAKPTHAKNAKVLGSVSTAGRGTHVVIVGVAVGASIVELSPLGKIARGLRYVHIIGSATPVLTAGGRVSVTMGK